MPFNQHKNNQYQNNQSPDIDAVATDAQAEALLPPHHIARTTYAARRSEGYDCSAALSKTLEEWRAFWESARPERARKTP